MRAGQLMPLRVEASSAAMDVNRVLGLGRIRDPLVIVASSGPQYVQYDAIAPICVW